MRLSKPQGSKLPPPETIEKPTLCIKRPFLVQLMKLTKSMKGRPGLR
jgi:hypothetical protein